jgi:RNA-binding motif protein, X-linked 2
MECKFFVPISLCPLFPFKICLTTRIRSPPEASWHTDYRDTAFVNFGGLPYNLSEGDIITIFSQFGEPVFLKLARDKETGKSKGFGWLKYEDQRSTDLAVDNLGGAQIGGRLVRVDHARYKARDDDDPEEGKIGWEDIQRREKAARGEDTEMRDGSSEEEVEEVQRPMIREERELQKLIEDHDEDDPMKAFLIDEKKEEVARALKELERKDRKEKKHNHREHRRHHHRSHRSRREDEGGNDDDRDRRSKRSTRDETPIADHGNGRDRGGTPEHRRRNSHNHDSRHRDRDRDRDGRDNRERPRDRDGGRDRRRDREYRDDGERRHRLPRDHEDAVRDREHRRRHRSRSRSP